MVCKLFTYVSEDAYFDVKCLTIHFLNLGREQFIKLVSAGNYFMKLFHEIIAWFFMEFLP